LPCDFGGLPDTVSHSGHGRNRSYGGVTGSVPLVTYEVSVSDVGHFTATISWKTNAAATSQVFYDTQPHEYIADYRVQTSEHAGLVSEHGVTFSRLRPRITYHLRVRSAIPGTEFVAISDNYSFATLSPPVVVVPSVPPAPPASGTSVSRLYSFFHRAAWPSSVTFSSE